jgi:hypothetical protein
MKNRRRVKSCGKAGHKTPLEIASRFPLSHSYVGDHTFPLTIVITFCKILRPASLRSDD